MKILLDLLGLEIQATLNPDGTITCQDKLLYRHDNKPCFIHFFPPEPVGRLKPVIIEEEWVNVLLDGASVHAGNFSLKLVVE